MVSCYSLASEQLDGAQSSESTHQHILFYKLIIGSRGQVPF